MSELQGAEFYEHEDHRGYGIKRRSGRYPWGSGGSEYARSMAFADYVKNMKNEGVPESVIAQGIGAHVRSVTGNPRDNFTVADLRSTTTISKEIIVQGQTHRAVQLRNKGVSIQKIAEELDIPAPTVRLRLKNSENQKKSSLTNTADILRKNVDEHQIVAIGKGTELHIDTGLQMGISPERLRAAVSVLRDEGYETYNLKIKNVGTNNFTNNLVLVPPGTTFGQANKMKGQIHTIADYTEDDGKTWLGIHDPISISSKRLKINYAEDGGDLADGVVYVRPGVKDLSMGKNTYAQVRIAIDGTHYIKGMAVLKDDLPAGTDLLFNTNKKRADIGTDKLNALKPMRVNDKGEVDKDNPFGTVLKRQIVEKGKDGVEKVTSALNIVNEAGDWDTWQNSLPSQVLAKQPHSLIRSQLADTRGKVQDRLDEINRITNPVVKKKALEDFADQIDSDAVDLRAASMPRQATRVIIPAPVKKGEIYAPSFETGERVALIRYPHGGRFEIPEVVVNNNARKAKKLLGNAKDAIGIHPEVAERLSGADFDGDTVVVIPNRSGKIKGVNSLGSSAKIYQRELDNYDPKRTYGGFVQKGTDAKGNPIGNFPLMRNTGKEMGVITNLITDMQIQGASPEHVVRAVKHSMVVIDAEKHKLNYKQSEADNNIKQLKELYQSRPGKKPGGATTLLSRATAKDRIPEIKERPAKQGGPIDDKTGERVYVPTGRTRNKYDPVTKTYDPNVQVPYESRPKRLAMVKDAYDLVRSPTDPVESLYADHANAMKQIANSARLKAYKMPNPPINTKAKGIYKDEVSKLLADLREARKQLPLDRQADIIANNTVKMKRQEDPLLREDRDRLAKVERQAKAAARARLGLEKPIIDVSPRQWDAIQAGAVSASKLREILGYTDPKQINDYALPKSNPVMTQAISARAKAMLAAGGTSADVAAALGIPLSTLKAAQQRGDV